MSRLQQKERELLDKIRESQEKLMQCKETYQNQMQKRIDNEKAKCKDETDIEVCVCILATSKQQSMGILLLCN